jgi:hypothetical protein
MTAPIAFTSLAYWQRRISTGIQKFNARISLYLAQCKIDGTRPCGGLGFANELKEIMFDEERFYGSSILSYTSLIYICHYIFNYK